MVEISTQTANKQAITRTVVSSLGTHGDALSSKLETLLFPGGAPADLTVRGFCEALLQLLQKDIEEVVRCDQEVARESGEDREAREARGSEAAALRQLMFRVRSALDSVGGEKAVAQGGLGGRIPDKPGALLPFARNVAKQVVTVTVVGGGLVTFDVNTAASIVSEAADRLEQALDNVANDTRETQAARSAHDDADATWRQHYTPLAGIAERLYRLVGMVHEADRVRPTSRRRAGLPEAPDDAPGETTGEAGEPAPTE